MKKRCVARNAAALILALIVMTACSNAVKEERIAEPLPEYSQVNAIESTVGGNSEAFSIRDGRLYNIATGTDELTGMVRSTEGDIIAQLVRIGSGQNVDNNLIKIYRNGKMMVVDSFFSASDIKLNGSGKRLAYRSYNKDSLDSVQKLKIFNLETRKTEEINSNVRVSGSVYCWIDDDNLLYYGTDQEKGGKAKIYKYNAATVTEEVYLEDLSGFCMYITPAAGGAVYFESTVDKANLCFAGADGGKKIITSELSELYDAEYNPATKELYLAGVKAGENTGALYKVNLEAGSALQRISYDFPKVVGATSTLAADSGGRIYFTGLLEGRNAGEMDVFAYDHTSGTVSILSAESGYYRLY
jgi:hypothetical protein